MTIYISGDSNSVRRNGWVKALGEDPRTPSKICNISIGGAPSQMSLLRALKQTNLKSGDIFVWAYGINDALYTVKAGYTCDDLVDSVRRIIGICAQADAVFAPMIFQPRRQSQQGGKSEYRRKLHALFQEQDIPYFDADEAYLTAHPDQDRLPLRFYQDYLHFSQTPEVLDFLADGALGLIRQAKVPAIDKNNPPPILLIEDFSPAEAAVLENSAVGRITIWNPGPRGLQIALPGRGRILGVFVATTQNGGLWNVTFGDRTVSISTAFADRQFNRTMLKFISLPAVTGHSFRFDKPSVLEISWAAPTDRVLADLWFQADLESTAVAAREARLVAVMVEVG